MITLCYATRKIRNCDLIGFTCSELINQLDPAKDLVLVPNSNFTDECLSCLAVCDDRTKSQYFNNWIEQRSFIESNQIDLEEISNQKIRNIILINFDSMDSSILKCLINKSKKTEIIGVSIEHTKYFRELQTEVRDYKLSGFSKNQIFVMMVLKHNCPPSLITECLDNIRFYDSNIKVNSIDVLSKIADLIKYGIN